MTDSEQNQLPESQAGPTPDPAAPPPEAAPTPDAGVQAPPRVAPPCAAMEGTSVEVVVSPTSADTALPQSAEPPVEAVAVATASVETPAETAMASPEAETSPAATAETPPKPAETSSETTMASPEEQTSPDETDETRSEPTETPVETALFAPEAETAPDESEGTPTESTESTETLSPASPQSAETPTDTAAVPSESTETASSATTPALPVWALPADEVEAVTASASTPTSADDADDSSSEDSESHPGSVASATEATANETEPATDEPATDEPATDEPATDEPATSTVETDTATSETETPPPFDPAASQRRRRNATIATVAALIVVLVGVPGFGLFYFSGRAKPGVTVLGQAVTGQTAAELTTTLTAQAANLQLSLTDGTTTVEAPFEELGISLDITETVDQTLTEGGSHPPWTTYLPWQQKSAPVVLNIDRTSFQDYLDQAFIPEAEAAVEASVTYDADLGQFVAHPSRVGLRVALDPVIQELESMAASGVGFTAISLTAETDIPTFPDQAAEQAAITANTRLGLNISLTNGQYGWSERSYQIPTASLAEWTVITPHPESQQFSVDFDQTKVATDLEPIINQQIATPMKPTIEVMNPESPTEVLGYEWGQSGTKAVDPGAAIAAVQQALTDGQNLSYTVPLVEDPATELRQLPPTNFDEPNGAKWIDVNKSTFLATAYEGTTQVNQFIISIGRGGAYETTDGTYYIYLKYRHQVMRGGVGTVEGRYEYATPVDWVSYFNLDIAFHGADWNTYQGTWQMRVSHGCVNLPSPAANWIFEWTPIGTKVVVHY